MSPRPLPAAVPHPQPALKSLEPGVACPGLAARRTAAAVHLVLSDCSSMDCSPPGSVGFPRQEYWSRLPFSTPGYLSNPGNKPKSSALAGGFFTAGPPGKQASCQFWKLRSESSVGRMEQRDHAEHGSLLWGPSPCFLGVCLSSFTHLVSVPRSQGFGPQQAAGRD